MINNILKTLGFITLLSAVFISGYLVLGDKVPPEQQIAKTNIESEDAHDSSNSGAKNETEQTTALNDPIIEEKAKQADKHQDYADAKKIFDTTTELPEAVSHVEDKHPVQKKTNYAVNPFVFKEPDTPSDSQYESAQKRLFMIINKLDAKTGR